MKLEYIQKAISAFENCIEGDNVQIVPCTLEEVTELEKLLFPPYKLPAAYKEFLLYGGRKMAGLFSMKDFSYSYAKSMLEEHYEEVIDVLQAWEEEEGKDYIDPEIFVLEEYLASNITYFKLTEGENPPVYFWKEGGRGLGDSKVKYKTFSDFLEKMIEIYSDSPHKKYIKKMKGRKD
ncbi:SMI1/KNR4 family protein [Baaleninema simplex]|uniref:SMI1/KNR4 family protein n=1 Tax=Baaleninema simplex TaxID=2862350 RepID=UPI00037131F3|nr:SMI1/KNR4 family protein [Baaleninema simplex]